MITTHHIFICTEFGFHWDVTTAAYVSYHHLPIVTKLFSCFSLIAFRNEYAFDNCKVTKLFEMGGACSAFGGEERRIQNFGAET
jgi:hypothetical protein